MSNSRAIRTAIADVLRSVPNIGVVHESEPYTKNTTLKKFYVDESLQFLRGWFLRRESDATAGEHDGHATEESRWAILGFSAFNADVESEADFDALLDDIKAAFRADDTLGGLVQLCGQAIDGGLTGIQIEDQGPAMLAGELTHAVRLVLHVTQLVEPAGP
jgi:hypothetical protein